MSEIDTLVQGYMEESEGDFVGLWQVASAARRRLGARTTDEARKLSLQIVKKLYQKGLRPGDFDLATRIDFWPDYGCQTMLDRIEREWIAAGSDPNLAQPICYFARPPG